VKTSGTEPGRYVREREVRASPPRAVIGLEAEFNLVVDGKRRRPEKIFGDPSRLVRRRMIPRTGKSFQLPTGGAIYFDTGVIEVATPIVELERGCSYRATRLLCERSWITGVNATAANAGCRALARTTTFHFPMRGNRNPAMPPNWRFCLRTSFRYRCFCWRQTGKAPPWGCVHEKPALK
jgi:hypothetical protein